MQTIIFCQQKKLQKFYSCLTIVMFGIFIGSCQKTVIDDLQLQKESINFEKDFFNLPSNTSATVIRIAETIKKQNAIFNFVNNLALQKGLPIWNKAKIQLSKSNAVSNTTPGTANNTNAGEDTVVLIPLVLQNTEFVNSFLACSVGDSISIRLFSAGDYAQFGFHNIPDSLSADKIALETMLLEQNVFDHREYHLLDQRLFNITQNGVTIHPEFCTLGSTNASIGNNITPSLILQVTTCTNVTVNGGWLVGCPPGANCINLITFQVCETWSIWIDDGGGGSCASCIPWWEPPPPITGGGGSAPPAGWYYLPVTIFNNLYYPVDVPDEILPPIADGIEIGLMSPTSLPPGRIIGKTPNRNNTEDMEHGNTCDVSGILSNMPNFTNDALFSEMNSLFDYCTAFDSPLNDVGETMIQKFKNKTGGTFTDPTLNQRVFVSSAFKKFIKYFGALLNAKLEEANWDINNVNTVDIPQEKRPKFNGTFNKFHGLQILVNDTELTEIELNDFTINPITHKWTAKITVTIKDHFGLDKNDALTYQNNHAGFAAWWILQHCRGYVPFESQIKIPMDLVCEPANSN